ncbi:MAG: Mrp/NBP35 family ATP-binding protein [Clostridia bacterium]|nr:Mrp/NBP35 family ATP-binding protein [Oscillospiraceae bacterium]MBQ8339874.1 Mrp/NBP35 family ATP-binding protein [Clostridia bacterium]
MAEECTHNCSTCSSDCASRKAPQYDKPNEKSKIGKIIGVVSGKGGVGKSMVTSLLAVALNRKGYRVGILDADITGPSIPKAFGLKGGIEGDESGLFPARTPGGIDVISLNLLLPDEKSPVIWRGPVIAGTVKQFYTDVIWDNIDYLLIDCPPGTGDVPLTVFQSFKVDGVVIVSSPQELVSMIVAKAANMANMMNIPVLGLVENMSFVRCPDCGKEIRIFGESHIEQVAAEFGFPLLAKMPIDPALSALVDEGHIEWVEKDPLTEAAESIVAALS